MRARAGAVRAARPRTYLKAEDRRAQILGVAKHLFARRGYRVANVADICQAAHIGRGTLYQYFANKRAVLLALMEDLQARIERVLRARPKLDEVPGGARVPVELIVRFCRKRLREVLDAVFVDEPTFRLILRDARGLDGAVDQIIGLIDNLVLQALETDLQAAQAAGILRAGDCRRMARYLIGGTEKLVLDALAQDAPIDLDTIVTEVVDLELFGILSKEVAR